MVEYPEATLEVTETPDSANATRATELARIALERHQPGTTFAIFDSEAVAQNLEDWNRELPDYQVHFAVKSCPHALLLRQLAMAGASFDCATPAEIEAVDAALRGTKVGSLGDRVIYSHPSKTPEELAYAVGVGVDLTVADSAFELRRIAAFAPRMRVLLRLRLDDPTAQQSLGAKFGAEPEDVDELLDIFNSAGVNFAGVSYHMGSHAQSPEAARAAVEGAGAVLRRAMDRGLLPEGATPIVDIGGGWSHAEDNLFPRLAASVREARAALPADVRLLSEPGRYIAENAFHLVCSIQGIRTHAKNLSYIVSESVYGWLSCIITDDYRPTVVIVRDEKAPEPHAESMEDDRSRVHPFGNRLTRGLRANADLSRAAARELGEYAGSMPAPDRPAIFWGCTCDSLDKIFTAPPGAPPLRPGLDWLVFPAIGAYSYATGTQFNSYKWKSCQVIEVVTAPLPQRKFVGLRPTPWQAMAAPEEQAPVAAA